jgi:hypothetical protein
MTRRWYRSVTVQLRQWQTSGIWGHPMDNDGAPITEERRDRGEGREHITSTSTVERDLGERHVAQRFPAFC